MRRQIEISSSLWFALASFALAFGGSAQAQEGTQGTILFQNIPSDLDNIASTGFRWRLPVTPQPIQGRLPLSQMRVVLVKEGEARPAVAARATIKGYRVEPLTMVVAPHTALTFSNKGSEEVTMAVVGRSSVTALKIDSEREGEVVLDKPGRYLFRATDYTSVLSYVIVVESVADSALTATAPDEASFDLGQVPAGSYELRVYFQGAPILQKSVEVSQEGKFNEGRFLLTREEFQKILDRP